ncbi:DUF423 domain-containing protein [Thauera linaloolentis]|uniref:Membrane protein n=1 Tax=Thauera linaloolentis (strain DSM 12138 / JCM 21573 / CCUG 41526 / CIP 105981 / IAM 15112 / NBRC 102519 / 47Lol) TaxID=1123367 RepID=N6Y8N8_THAL4|nr:DUF423 domain-containing protein [Thauera linaloolentis]ENO90691.1 membrane protein [Thauera linaloolentis 47Lol = DSM 12138]MCM8565599.1 DUF423 domain-containing protein [Thauera linaloolentis]
MNKGCNGWITLAGLLGALGVGVAAWSSHGLPHFLPADQLALGQARAQAANLHLLLHTVALFGIGLWLRQGPNPWAHAAGVLFTLGILGFSGGIYVLRIFLGIHEGALTNAVPAGGFFLIFGWLALAVGGWRQGRG